MNIKINCHFINGAFVEIVGDETNKTKYKVEFIDKSTNKIDFSIELGVNSWARTAKKYFVDWRVLVYDGNTVIYSHELDFTDKRVLIEFCSSSLGDTLAWFSAVDTFQKKHNCTVFCSTFINSLFIETYKNINFITPGSSVNNIYAQYKIGWFYNEDEVDFNLNPYDFKKFNLQETAFQILGIPFIEERPKLNVPTDKIKKNQVCIGIHSTANAKYWHYPNGWQTVINYLNKKNYDVILISKEPNGWMGTQKVTGVDDKSGNYSLEYRIEQLAESKLFIGLGSGLSWLAWASGIDTILISGFSEKYAEFTPTARLINEKVCHGCFNNFRLNASDWNWCPVFKNTDKQFICSKEISPDEVIHQINKILNIS
jgi:autotransporter strand-loop-strand O-heptosyltransferase